MQKVFGLCVAQHVTQIDESIHTGEDGHERVWKQVKTNLNTRRGEGRCQECERMKNRKVRSVTRNECKRHQEEFEVGGFMAQEEFGNSPQIESWKIEEPCLEKTETCSVNTEPCTTRTFSAGR